VRRIAEKRVALATAIERVERWKAEGRRVVFANGVFDLVHVGHARYLAGARALGDRLVVGVNGDAATRALKGPGRPVLSAEHRATLIAALRPVDLVIVFEEPTADRVLEALAPDVHAKGTDYRTDSVPERDTVARLGGTVAIAGDEKAHSSRELFARVRERYSAR
jgi:rfaE bifunctional protein nucleotidyltransferase chain/domain